MILLTGATGSAGSFVANEFVRQRVPVRILVRNRARATELEKVPTVEIVEGDMSSRSSLGSVLDGVDRALMISAPLMDMVETQCTFIDVCKAAGVHQVIKFSGLDSRRDTAFPFGRMHKDIEEYLERSGVTWTHLRPTGFMQEYLREAPSIIKEGAFYLALGDVRLNPVDLVDVGSAHHGRNSRLHITRDQTDGAVRRSISDRAPTGVDSSRYPSGVCRCSGQSG